MAGESCTEVRAEMTVQGKALGRKAESLPSMEASP
jgi:hypothetical protein